MLRFRLDVLILDDILMYEYDQDIFSSLLELEKKMR